MADEFAITLETAPTPETLQAIENALFDFNRSRLEDDYQLLTVVVRNAAGEVVGGLQAETYWGWMFIKTLALREEAREHGIGTRLMALAEAEAIRRGCRHAYLDTFDFQARPFYEQHGYAVFGHLDDFPGEHTRYFLRKDLSANP